MAKVMVSDILALKNKRRITMLTAYDYSTAALVDTAGIDIILVGDSVANVVLGLESTTEVGMDAMIHHSRAVVRGVKNALVVSDMPFEAIKCGPAEVVAHARRFIDEAGCDCVKIEWTERCSAFTRNIVAAGIPVMGHIGLTPQTADQLGGFKIQGKDALAAKRLIAQAVELADAGCFAIVLECVPDRIAKIITEKIPIPTIGIGAGKYTDGQVLVLHDAIGLFDRYTPKFAKKFIDLSPLIVKALEQYRDEVQSGQFPDDAHSFHIKEEELKKLNEENE
jgi:3-methyl-2-oxobutanoate hydroxymethyltransferase